MTDQIYSEPPANGDPTAPRKSRKSFDVLRFCDCGRHGGLHGIAPGCPGMADELVQLIPGDTPGTIRAGYDPNFQPYINPDGTVNLIPFPDDADAGKVLTLEIVASFEREQVHANNKPGSLQTYRKYWKPFGKAFEYLPTDRGQIVDYLSRYDGPSGRNRRNHQDGIHALYKHAVALGWLASDPMVGMKRPQLRHRPPNPLTLEQAKIMFQTPKSDRDRAALHLLLGHGWRQIEVRRVMAGDVRGVRDGSIWCWGKARDEWAPILPETVAILEQLAVGKSDDAAVFVGHNIRYSGALSESGIARLVDRLFVRAGLDGFQGHDLRRAFITLVTQDSEELLGMRLGRDRVQGVNDRYVSRDLSTLLAQHSPLRQAAGLHSLENSALMPGNARESDGGEGETRTPTPFGT